MWFLVIARTICRMATLQQQARALGDPTRHEIFRYIADASFPVDVAELTDHFGLNHNAIRQHLAKLVDAGLVVEDTAPSSGRGRPRLVYVLDPGAESRWGVTGPYERLSRWLAEMVRTGDTPPCERAQMRRKPPHIVVTTPESLYILLGSASGREMLATTKTVIVDEIHAIAGTKRGSHLALSLERLDALAGRRLTRIGLSATQEPIAEVARLLVGVKGLDAEGNARFELIEDEK